MRTEHKGGLQELIIIALSQQPTKIAIDLNPIYSTGCKELKRTEHVAWEENTS